MSEEQHADVISLCAHSVESDSLQPHQAPMSIGFLQQEYWSGEPLPPPEDLSNLGIEPASLASLALQVDSLPLVPPGKPHFTIHVHISNHDTVHFK